MENNIVQYIKGLAMKKGVCIDENTNLFENDIFDSLEIIKFLAYLEEIGVALTVEDLNFEHFQSINAIICLIKNNII